LKETIKNYYKAYRKPGSKTIATGSQSALAETLFIIGERNESFDELLQQLVERIELDKFCPTVGEVSFSRLLRTLAQGECNDIIWRMIHRTDKPGYGYMLRERGMKTLSETWDGPGSSMNHCMFGHIQEWFSSQIVGINILKSNLNGNSAEQLPLFVLNPTPVGDLTWAKGHYDSIYGRVNSSWKIEQDRFIYRCSVPANTTAELVLPSAEIISATVSGKPMPLCKGNRTVLDSGDYEITVKFEK